MPDKETPKDERPDDEDQLKITTEPEQESEAPGEEPEEQQNEAPAEAPQPPAPHTEAVTSLPPKRRGVKRFFHWYGTHKKLSIPLTIIVVIAVLAGIPWTRYTFAGLVLRQTYSVTVTDAQTKQPVSSALVSLDGQQLKTDSKGAAKIKAHVGKRTLQVSKKYYTAVKSAVLVPILKQKNTEAVQLTATGRQVTVTIVNKISGKSIADATVSAAGTEAKTDKDGHATIVLPADKATVTAKLAATGFNAGSVTITVTTQTVASNTLSLTPAGKLYFLSNLSGKIDVVKTDLDGSNRQTVLAGTGKEDNANTVLLASRDWHYLALLSKRDGGTNPKLFLIDTTSDSLTTMDEGNASFQLTGWSNHKFLYIVNRTSVHNWESGQQAFKSFDADSKKIAVLDQTAATGGSDSDYLHQYFNGAYILQNEVIYSVGWQASYYDWGQLGSKQATLMSVKSDGTNKHVVRSFGVPSGTQTASVDVALKLYEPQGIYVLFNLAPTSTVYEYEDGQLKEKPDVSSNDFYNTPYPTYLISPASTQTFWSEARDGKNTLFVGDASGGHPTQIATLSDYAAYGWYTDNYLLVSKNGSELAIVPATGGTPLKVTDYYKPQVSFAGYGYGYGGL